MSMTRKFARPLLASIFLTGALDAFRNPEPRAEMAKPLLDKVREVVPSVPDNVVAVQINSATQIVCAALLAKGVAPRITSLVLAATLVPTTLAGHPFWKASADARPMQRLQFFKNLSIFGGLLLASVDTDGKPSLAWRAHHISRPNWMPDGD